MTELIQSDLQQSPLSAFLQEFPDLPVQRRFRMQAGGRIHFIRNTIIIVSYDNNKWFSFFIIQHSGCGADADISTAILYSILPWLIQIFPCDPFPESTAELLQVIRMNRSF